MTVISYVVDTSVLLSVGTRALYAFPDSEVIVPLAVIKELEKQRNDPSLGFVARGVLRHIEDLRVKYGNGIKTGVEISPGVKFRIEVNHVDRTNLPASVRSSATDVGILAVAHNLQEEEKREVVLVTNDLPLRIIAQISVGMQAQEYVSPEASQGDFPGLVTAECSAETMSAIHNGESVLANELYMDTPSKSAYLGVVVKAGTSSALGVLANGEFSKLSEHRSGSITGRSAPQKLALAYLNNPDIGVVSLGGRAGTGKTVLALAAGMDQILEEQRYKKVVVFRPLLAVGNQDLGYLPGTEDEKMAPWAAAIYDALDVVARGNKNVMESIIQNKQLEVLPVTHIRGRTLTDSLVIIDEAQNLERNVLLSVLSRTGSGTKVVLCWDAAQRDNLHIGRNDGITSLVERLKSEDIFAHVTLTKSERSPVAAMASGILEEFH